MSRSNELRFGTHGSLAVDLDKGVWHDHEEGVGGGVLDLIDKKTGITSRSGQLSWLKKNGLKERQPKLVPARPKAVPKPKVDTTYAYADAADE